MRGIKTSLRPQPCSLPLGPSRSRKAGTPWLRAGSGGTASILPLSSFTRGLGSTGGETGFPGAATRAPGDGEYRRGGRGDKSRLCNCLPLPSRSRLQTAPFPTSSFCWGWGFLWEGFIRLSSRNTLIFYVACITVIPKGHLFWCCRCSCMHAHALKGSSRPKAPAI